MDPGGCEKYGQSPEILLKFIADIFVFKGGKGRKNGIWTKSPCDFYDMGVL